MFRRTAYCGVGCHKRGIPMYLRCHTQAARAFRSINSTQGLFLGRQRQTTIQCVHPCVLRSRNVHSLNPSFQPSTFTDPQLLLQHFSENAELMGAEQISETLMHFTDLLYKSLTQYPWLQPVKSVARLQLILSGKEKELIGDFRNNDGYRSLIEKVEEHCAELPDLQLIKCLDATTHLFEDLESTLVHKLLRESIQRQSQFNLRSLAEFGGIIRHLPKGIFFVSLHSAIKRFKELLPALERNVTPQGLCDLSDALRNFHLYLSDDLVGQSCMLLLSVTQACAEEISDVETINSVSYMARRMYASEAFMLERSNMRRVPVEIMKYAKIAAVRNVEKYDPRHIAEICSSLKLTKQYTRDVSEVFVKRSLELLSTDLPLCDVTNLFYCLSSQVPRQSCRKFESVLYPKLASADTLTLSNLAEAFDQVDLENQDILLRFQQLVVENSDVLCQASSRLFFVLKYLLNRTQKMDDDVKKHLLKMLMAHMKKNQVITSFHTPTVANFCLQCTSGKIPEFLFNEVTKSIPQWRIKSLKKVLVELSENKQIYQPQLQMLITEIQHQIYLQVVEKPYVIDNVRQLTSFVHLMALHAYYRDQAVTEKLMRLYLNFMDELDQSTMLQVVKIFTILKYYLPDVFDQLIKVLLEKDFALEVWVQTLGVCSMVGYTPTDLNEFVVALLEKLNAAGESEEDAGKDAASSVLVQELRAMRWLSLLQFYPEERLMQIFSLDFIEKVDDFLTVHPGQQREVEDTMMELNRNVFLECPQLDVPWFHESYCQKHLRTDENAGNYKHEMLRDSVYECLEDALGGSQYIQKSAVTPYYYTLDFECVLDRDNNAVDYNVIDDKRHPDLQRVAILPFTEGDFCYNTKRMINTQKTKLRHLEILGYKVIQIPNFTWYSMGLADHDSKVDLLRNRIFGSS